MRLSLNEIEVTVRKAALGVGFPLGLAEDAGAAAAWLATAGLPVAEPIAAALFHGCGEEPRLVPTGTVCTIATDTGRCSVLRAGPSACDFVIAAAASGKRIAVEAFVDVPMIAIAQAGIASADAALPLVVEIAGRPAALLGGNMPVLFAAPAELAALVANGSGSASPAVRSSMRCHTLLLRSARRCSLRAFGSIPSCGGASRRWLRVPWCPRPCSPASAERAQA